MAENKPFDKWAADKTPEKSEAGQGAFDKWASGIETAPPPAPKPPTLGQRARAAVMSLADAAPRPSRVPGDRRGGAAAEMRRGYVADDMPPMADLPIPEVQYSLADAASATTSDMPANTRPRVKGAMPWERTPEQVAKVAQIENLDNGGSVLDRPADPLAGGFRAASEQQRALSDRGERGRDARMTSASMSEATPAQVQAMNLDEAGAGGVQRGAIAGFAQMGQIGLGAMRLVGDLTGSETIAGIASEGSKAAEGTGRAAMQGLEGGEKLAAQVTSSIINSAPALALGMVGGPALTTLFAQSTLSEYNAGRNAGFEAPEALTRAGIMGLGEALGERFGLSEQIKLLKGAVKGLPQGEVAQLFGTMLAKEIPGEQLTTAVQFLADKIGPAALNPNATLADYLEAAADTLKVTVGQSLVMGGGPAAVSTARNVFQKVDASTAAPEAQAVLEIDRAAQAYERLFAPAPEAVAPTAARADSLKRFDEAAAAWGLKPKAAEAVRAQAGALPADDVPGFLARATVAMNQRGMFQRPIDDTSLDALDRRLRPETAEPDAPPVAGPKAPADALPTQPGAAAADDFTGLATSAPAIATPVDEAAHAAATSPMNERAEPTQSQKEAGNYAKGHTRISGLDITIENPQGSVRRGIDGDGKAWETPMAAHYGYVRGTRAGDGDHSDVFIKAGTPPDARGPVFVIDQIDPKTGKFDEHKSVVGAATEDEARALYLANYDAGGDQRIGAVTQLPWDAFKSWVRDGVKRAPLGQLVSRDNLAALPAGGTISDTSGPELENVAGAPATPAGSAPTSDQSAGPRDQALTDLSAGLQDLAAVLQPAPADSVSRGTSARVIARAGRTPSATEPVELRSNADGTLTPHLGAAPMVDFDSGEPIMLAADVNDEDAKKAIRAAGAITSKTLFFPAERSAPAAKTKSPAASIPPAKVFKSRDAASKAREEAGNTQRVQKVKDGFILRQATDKELAAAERNGKRLAGAGGVDVDRDSLLKAIAKLGGIHPSERADTVGEGNRNVGGKMLFTRSGKRLDDLAAGALREFGYVPLDEVNRDGGVRWLRDAIKSEFMGSNSHYSEQGTAWMEERSGTALTDEELDAARAAYEAEQAEALSDFTVDELEDAGYIGASPEVQALTEQLLAEAAALGADVDMLRENADSATRGQHDDQFHAEAQRLAQEAIQAARPRAAGSDAGPAGAGREDRRQSASGEGQAPADEGLSLQAQTSADLQAKADREAAGAAAEKAARTAEQTRLAKEASDRDNRARADETVDNFELGQSAEQQMSGMADLFADAPPAPAVATKVEPGDSDAVRQAKADLMAGLGDLASLLSKNTRANITPEAEQQLLPILTRVFDAAFRLGYLQFKDAAKFVLDQVRNAIGTEAAGAITLDHLQGAYIGMAGRYKEHGASSKRDVVSVEDKAEIEAHQAHNAEQGTTDVPDPNSNLERDRADAAAADPSVGGPVSVAGSSDSTWAAGSATGSRRRGRPDDPSLPAGGAAAAGEPGNQPVHRDDGAREPAELDAGADDGARSDDPGHGGTAPETVAASAVADAAESGLADAGKRQRQRAADRIPVTPGDLDNIRATLPYLLPGQQEDVHKAEQRFAKPDGYGIVFTNGTGTGKTFTGLGMVKRFARQGKTNVLILVPDAKIMADWVESGLPLGLAITPLVDTKDAGKGITITTYANASANDALATREWDLVVPDEAHGLMQAADGKDTLALDVVRAVMHHPRGAQTRYEMLHRPELEQMADLSARIDANTKILSSDDTMEAVARSVAAENAKLEQERSALRKRLDAARTAVGADIEAHAGAKRARLLALSATPFAYEKTVDWAEGYLFDYMEGYPYDVTSTRYNQPSPYEYFFITHFGYRMRVNKLTEPEAKVDRGLLQRQFNGWLKKRGVLSGRMLDVAADYDRRFVMVESAIGNAIDRAIEHVQQKTREEAEASRALSEANPSAKLVPSGWAMLNAELNEHLFGRLGYLNRRYLLEAIKAKESIPHIREHLAKGRKIVVFHDFKQGGSVNPFEFSPKTVPAGVEPALRDELQGKAQAYNRAAQAFSAEFPELAGDLMARLISPIELYRQQFPNVLVINGNEKPKDNLARYKTFNDDAAGPIVALVQSDKNKGWSGHDTTGKHQRALFNLGLPTQPTKSIQQEGRIYRTGQVSDALFRYFNTGTSWERWAFAETIATRAGTAENLGMGELARALKDSFITGFEESGDFRAGHEGEGKGGKERDRLANDATSEYDRAKAFYWGTQKKNSRTKAEEGADYYATPEPVGLKMVEWADARGGEDSLEPSAGHGAIARWFGDTVNRTAIEPSNPLGSRLAMVFDGKIVRGAFEDHNVINKYDVVVMNPPFGTAGRTAVDHVAKAATHLRDYGRIVALIPEGPATDKKFEKWFYEEAQRPLKPVAEHPTLGPIYKGDTIKTRASWLPSGVVTAGVTAGNSYPLMAQPTGTRHSSGVTLDAITEVSPTGKRTESYRPAEGLYLSGEVKLPAVTFERAGTAVRTRVLIIDKLPDGETPPSYSDKRYDLSGVSEINELFDRLEDISFPKRAKEELPEVPELAKKGPVELAELQEMQDAATGKAKVYMAQAVTAFEAGDAREAGMQADAARLAATHTAWKTQAEKLVKRLQVMARDKTQAAATGDRDKGRAEGAAAAAAAGLQIVEHVTGKGKKLRGIVRTDLNREQASAIDPFTFKKDGGFFIRVEHIAKMQSGEADGGVRLRQGGDQVGMTRAAVQQAIDQLRSAGIVGVQVAGSIADMPTARRDAVLAQAPDGRVRGAYFRGPDETWLVAENLADETELYFTLMHESFHRGFAKTFGDEGKQVLRSIHASNKRVRSLTEQQIQMHGLELDVAIEEALADLAGSGAADRLNMWPRLIRMVKAWLQRAADALGIRIKWTDSMVNAFVAGVRSEGLRAAVHVTDDSAPALSRKPPKHTPQQVEALRRAGIGGATSAAAKTRAYWGAAMQLVRDRGQMGQAVRQGALDQFTGIRTAIQREIGNLPVDQDPYIAARLANGGTSSVMRALLLHGQAKWAANGQHLEKVPGTVGLLDILKPLGDDVNDWFGWMIGNRANRLMAEGRENNFTQDQIDALRSLATPEKLPAFQKAATQYTAFKRSVLDIAQAAGLINPESRKVWDHADYIPFYREIDERAVFSVTGKRGLSGQSSGIRTLKGGQAALNDPMENLLMNFSRLVDAALKNNAISKTVRALEAIDSPSVHKVGFNMTAAFVPTEQVRRLLVDGGTAPVVLDAIPEDVFEGISKLWALQQPTDPDVVRVMRDGKPQFYRVNDGLLLRALTSFVPFDFPGLAMMRAAKRLLTATVTATPEFMLRNWIRDSVSVQAIGRTGFNPAASITGIAKSYRESGGFEAMLFAGASFQSGNVNAADPEGTGRAVRRALRARGMDASSVNAFMGTVLDTGARFWERYREVGDAIENANREAVYEATLKSGEIVNGVPQDMRTAAVYEAKDVMDFSLRGSWAAYQLLADVLPFFNARVQGLYRLGRADPKRLALVGMSLTVASLMLGMANDGEDWYEELPDWDKDTFWHFRIGETHWRLPKPFEVGVMFATVPERISRYIKGFDAGKKTAGRVWANVRDQLAFDPVPQLLRPVLNVWGNHDTFRDSPIESMSDEGKLPHLRFSARTSDTMRVAADLASPLADATGMSPKRLEYLIGGYLGTAGLYALGMSDMLVRQLEGKPPGPSLRADDIPVVKAFYRVDPARATVFESDLYKMRNEVEQIFRSINASLRDNPTKARELIVSEKDKLAVRGLVVGAVKAINDLNRQRDRIQLDEKLSPDQKRVRIDALQLQKNAIAKKVAENPKVKAAF